MGQVQIVENWSEIEGVVEEVGPSAELDSYVVARVKVDRTGEVEGFPNLLGDLEGRHVDILLPKEQAERSRLSAGAGVRCRVRRGGPKRNFVHPDHLEVS